MTFSLEKETNLPVKGKTGRVLVQLDQSLGGSYLAEADLDLSNFYYGEFKKLRLHLRKCPGSSLYLVGDHQPYIDIALKGHT